MAEASVTKVTGDIVTPAAHGSAQTATFQTGENTAVLAAWCLLISNCGSFLFLKKEKQHKNAIPSWFFFLYFFLFYLRKMN